MNKVMALEISGIITTFLFVLGTLAGLAYSNWWWFIIGFVLWLAPYLLFPKIITPHNSDLFPICYGLRCWYWKKSTQDFKEKFFIEFFTHCIHGDYYKDFVPLLEFHKISLKEFNNVLYRHQRGRVNELHPQWEEIAFLCFTHYQEVKNVAIARVEPKFHVMIYTFKENLYKKDLPLIIQNEMFNEYLEKI